MPIIETYRGVGIHDFQSRERIETVVKPEIDRVHAMSDSDELAAVLDSARWSPEAHILAGSKIIAISERAADKRLPRPDLDLRTIAGVCNCLTSHWHYSPCYGLMFGWEPEEAVERPLEFQAAFNAHFHPPVQKIRPALAIVAEPNAA
jgi:hypothetical protein